MRSSLEIFDLASGQARVVLDVPQHIEAPNWQPDGRALVVNGQGRLFRVPLEAPALEPVDLPLTQLNNDHGIALDGCALAISDKTETGKSCIYTVPRGGAPRRITDQVPSWWHGWSPDGARLAYTCVRNQHFGIATIPVDGGQETLLVTSPHHYDGPDYTPDGNWIWFNSDRGGQMHLWRMAPDGADLQEMTTGDTVDWFPHPSPDGRHVLYLAYPPGTNGHPFGRAVTLNLMPADGGAPDVLLHLFGGQGTLNVPCWAPDSGCFAFVRYFEKD